MAFVGTVFDPFMQEQKTKNFLTIVAICFGPASIISTIFLGISYKKLPFTDFILVAENFCVLISTVYIIRSGVIEDKYMEDCRK